MKKKLFLATLLAISFVLTGCGGSSNENTLGNVTGNKDSYTAKLEDGIYYVRDNHSGTNECVPVYFGNGTFNEGTITTRAEKDRVLWYKDDADKIPTLYKGDSLIYFTKGVLDEHVVLERFEDFKYTIGICNMEEIKSGRYEIYTDPDKKCTYPGSETDHILQLSNESVILDFLGDKYIRAVDEEDEIESYLSRCGTLLGLEKDTYYDCKIYEGTIEHEYSFPANIWALGSMEVWESYDYKFTEDNIIEVELPEWLNTGYYLINGQGLFRYVDGTVYDATTNFNIPNEELQNNDYGEMQFEGEEEEEDFIPEPEDFSEAPLTDEQTKFEVTEPGKITVKISFTSPSGYEDSSYMDVTAIISTPSGGNYQMTKDENGNLSRTFDAEVGVYNILYMDLGNRSPHVTFE